MGAMRRTRKITETVQLERYVAGVEDAHGNVEPGFDTPEPVGIWRFNPGGSQEPVTAGHTRVITEPEIYFPGPQFGAQDRVTVRGIVYEVDGEQPAWISDDFTGCVTKLRKVDG